MGDSSKQSYAELQREYEEFRVTSAELEDQLEIQLEELQDHCQGLEQECSAIKAKRKRELKEHAEVTDRLEAEVADLKEKQKEMKEKLRILEVDDDNKANAVRHLTSEKARILQQVEDLQEECVLLKGDLADSQAQNKAAHRQVEHLKREISEASTKGTRGSPPSAQLAHPVQTHLPPSSTSLIHKALSDAIQLGSDWDALHTSLTMRSQPAPLGQTEG